MQFQNEGRVSTYGTHAMPRWDGGVNPSDGRSYQCIWTQAAERCLARETDPVRLVRAAFDLATYSGSGYMPVPTRLLSEEAFTACEFYKLDDPDRLAAALISYDAEVDAGVLVRTRYRGLTPEAALLQVLRDGTLNLSPLYRYCRLIASGHDAEASAFVEGAFQTYLLASTCYDRAWGTLIPEVLRFRLRAFLGLE
jgi:hypothetical protein